MSPFQHGEVFVTDDGAETDLDIGHYERFTDENSFADSNVTTGKVYWKVITKERRGDYSGRHGTGHPSHHRRNQGAHLQRREPRKTRRGYHRDRRHGGRHRVAALPRNDPPDQVGGRRGKLHVHPRHAAALPWQGGRTQDQTHAAQRQRAARRSASIPTSSYAAAKKSHHRRLKAQDIALL